MELFKYDVLVIGAGGAGLRAAIAAKEEGASVAIISKSPPGKAHTVMAEGGIAAALGNLDSADNWEVHFRDTLKGGKFLNDWRMVKLHTQDAPVRVLELEQWGAGFDHTPDGKILQRPFGGHSYRRLCHKGDKTGLVMLQTLQKKAIASEIDFHSECLITHLVVEDGSVAGAFGFYKDDGRCVVFQAKAVVLATGGLGEIWQVNSNSYDCTGDGYALAYAVGAAFIDMEFVQFHPTGMVWPMGVRGMLVTEAVRGEGGILKNKHGERFMEKYDPERMELSTRDIVSKAIYSEIKNGNGSEHGGVYLDISHKSVDEVKQKLPAMYEQFMDLADIDITKHTMEVGPTCHYMMGGIKVDPATEQSTVDGLFAAGEVVAGAHGATRLGGNSLSDLLVFGNRAGVTAADFARLDSRTHRLNRDKIKQYEAELVAYFDSPGTVNPYVLHHDLQRTMQENVGIVRNEAGLKLAQIELDRLKLRLQHVKVQGNRKFNPAWHKAVALKFMLNLAELITRAAIERTESRGAHTRDDYPVMVDEWGKKHIVITNVHGEPHITTSPVEPMPNELKKLITG
ncbi:FAD-binding protein [candidate division KSB1 bacterium]|nr:FAD-binding protein [candidate division KSB1 bacterium]